MWFNLIVLLLSSAVLVTCRLKNETEQQRVWEELNDWYQRASKNRTTITSTPDTTSSTIITTISPPEITPSTVPKPRRPRNERERERVDRALYEWFLRKMFEQRRLPPDPMIQLLAYVLTQQSRKRSQRKSCDNRQENVDRQYRHGPPKYMQKAGPKLENGTTSSTVSESSRLRNDCEWQRVDRALYEWYLRKLFEHRRLPPDPMLQLLAYVLTQKSKERSKGMSSDRRQRERVDRQYRRGPPKYMQNAGPKQNKTE